jgi:hypothetical protein
LEVQLVTVVIVEDFYDIGTRRYAVFPVVRQ